MILRATLGRTVFSFSLAVGACMAFAGNPPSSGFARLDAQARATQSPTALISLVAHDPGAKADPDIRVALQDATQANTSEQKTELAKRLRSMIALRTMTEVGPSAADAGARIKSIKDSALYRDAGVAEDSNWLAKALERLKNLRVRAPETKVKSPGFDFGFLGPWIVRFLWTVLAVGIIVLGYFAVRHIDWKRRTARRTKAVLEADEPERSLDEWLEAADRLTAQGQYREAVRALYLACLLRFDEYRIARFDRRETNWEHLRRIHQSPKRPAMLDFAPATKAFDRIWYGKDTQGLADVEQFRAWYGEYAGLLREART